MAKRYTNSCSILEVSREMHIKTTKRRYFYPLIGGWVMTLNVEKRVKEKELSDPAVERKWVEPPLKQ